MQWKTLYTYRDNQSGNWKNNFIFTCEFFWHLFLVRWNASADSCSFLFLSLSLCSCFCIRPIYVYFSCNLSNQGHKQVCVGWVCLGITMCGLGVCRCVWDCSSICGYAWECMGMGRRVWDEFSEYPLETRVLTSADFNKYPIWIFMDKCIKM